MSAWVVLVALAAADPDLEQAAQALEQGQFDAVAPALARARSHPLSVEDQIRAYELEAFTTAAFDDVFAERRAFDALLALQPDYALPRRAGPKMQAIFLEAQHARAAAPVPAPAPSPLPPVEAAPAEAPPSPARLHLAALALVGLTTPRSLGADVSATFRTLPILDLGLGLSIGAAPAPELIAELHLPDFRLSPFLQVRGLLAFPSGQVALGAGAWLGVALRLGPGRVQAALAGELYRAPVGFSSAALLLAFGYALDPGAL